MHDRSGTTAEFLRAVAGAEVVIEGDIAVVGGIRVPMATTSRDEARRLVGAPRRRARAIGVDDVRRIALALPGATEREKRTRDGRTVLSFEVDKTMFVKLFEAGNLTSPDLDDVVMIRRVPDRPAVLADAPDRFFVTAHYGDPSTPGAVLTRLSENGRRDLPELAELIEASWAECAPARLRAARDAG